MPPPEGAKLCPSPRPRKCPSSLGKQPFAPWEVPGDDAGGRDPCPVCKYKRSRKVLVQGSGPALVAKLGQEEEEED